MMEEECSGYEVSVIMPYPNWSAIAGALITALKPAFAVELPDGVLIGQLIADSDIKDTFVRIHAKRYVLGLLNEIELQYTPFDVRHEFTREGRDVILTVYFFDEQDAMTFKLTHGGVN